MVRDRGRTTTMMMTMRMTMWMMMTMRRRMWKVQEV
jgi:hypothetical protein